MNNNERFVDGWQIIDDYIEMHKQKGIEMKEYSLDNYNIIVSYNTDTNEIELDSYTDRTKKLREMFDTLVENNYYAKMQSEMLELHKLLVMFELENKGE